MECLKNEIGEWITDKQGMKHVIITYLRGLFCTLDAMSDISQFSQLFPRLEEDDLTNLSSLVSMEEIKISVFPIGGLKTPSHDRFPAIFYQKILGDVPR